MGLRSELLAMEATRNMFVSQHTSPGQKPNLLVKTFGVVCEIPQYAKKRLKGLTPSDIIEIANDTIITKTG